MKIKVNTTKCKHILYTLRNNQMLKLKRNNTEIPQTKTVNYLGL